MEKPAGRSAEVRGPSSAMEQNPSTCHLAGYSRNPNIASVIAQLKTHQLESARANKPQTRLTLPSDWPAIFSSIKTVKAKKR